MHKIIIPLDTTNATLVAVIIISLNSVIKEVAHGAKICSKLDTALIICAYVGHGLSVIALITHHLFDSVPIHFMGLGVIVAVAAHILLAAAGGYQKASAHIVLTTWRLVYVSFFFTVVVTFVVHICSPI
jgi:hypothetical protein